MEQETGSQTIEAPIPAAVETQEPINSYKSDPGYYSVDLSHLPEDVRKPIEDRFNYFFRQVKDQNRTLGQFRSVAEQQSAQINELMSATTQVVDHLQNRSFEDTEATLKATIRQAKIAGDTDAEFDATDKLIELKASKMMAAKTQPKAENQSTQRINSINQISDEARSAGEISPEDHSVFNAWMNEKDQSGNLVRPWAFTNDMNDPHFKGIVTEASAVFSNPRFANAAIDQKLTEIDRRMGVNRQVAQSVMGGNLTTNKKSGTIRLSPDQEKIAIRMNVGARKGEKPRTDAEKISAYIEQMKKVQSNRGVR